MSRTFTQIGGGKVFRPWGHWTEGDSIVGKLVGTSEDSFGNENFEIEVEEVEFDEEVVETKNKNGEKVEMKAPKVGDIFVLNSCGSLERAMQNCDNGDIIKVIYTGEIILNKGKFKGKKAHTMKVMRAEGNKKIGTSISQPLDNGDVEEDALG